MVRLSAVSRFVLALALALTASLLGVHAASAAPVVIATVTTGGAPNGLTVSPDGTRVYVTDYQAGSLFEIDAATNTLLRTMPNVAQGPTAVAINAAGTAAYVVSSSFDEVVEVNLGTGTVSRVLQVGVNPQGMSIDPTRRYLYVSNAGGADVSIVDTSTWTVTQTVLVGMGPTYSGVSLDDTVYVPAGDSTVSVIDPQRNPATNTSIDAFAFQMIPSPDAQTVYATSIASDEFIAYNSSNWTRRWTVPLPGDPAGFALSPDGSTAYVTKFTPNQVAVIDIATRSVTDTITVGALPFFLTISPDGQRVYVGNYLGGSVSVISTAGVKTVTFDPNGGSGAMAPQSAAAPTALTTNAFTRSGYTFAGWNTAPGGNGTPYSNQGVYPFAADDTLYAQWTAVAPPPPPPVFPPSAPQSVAGVAGDASAAISWSAPSFTGTFPLTNYQVEVSPGGRTCLVPATTTTCTITGLSNGTTYTAAVRALNGAGWSPYSTSSSTFTPEAPEPPAIPTITITGTRGDVRGKPGVNVTGITEGLSPGTMLKPWFRFPGQDTFTEGRATILVDPAGAFTWSRQTSKRITVIIKSADGAATSNTVTIKVR